MELVWFHIVSDALIAIAYYSIPITLVYFVRKRGDLPFNWIVWLFGAFITACGTSHIIEIWTLWYPTYWLSGLVKAITALISAYTAIALVLLVPKALALPSPSQLKKANTQLEHEILERKQVEEALRESEERFRKAFDYAAIGKALVALDGRWLKANSTLCEILGYSEQELLSLTFQDITHPDDLDTDLDYVQQLLRGEIRYCHLEKRYFHKQGHVVWILLSVSLVRDTEGQPLYFIGQIQDISERKRTEEALKDSEQRWQLVIQGNNDGVWDLDLRTNQVFRSARYAQMLGYEPDEIGDDNDEWLRCIHPDDFERVMQVNQDYFDRKIPHYAVEYRLRCKDGSYKWVLGRAQVVWDEAGNPVRMVGTTRDISNCKQAEVALRESEARYRCVIDNVKEVIFQTDAEGLWTFLNPAWAEIMGFTPEESIGTNFLNYVHPDDRQRNLERFQPLIARQKDYCRHEIRYLAKDGDIRWIEVFARLTLDANNAIIGTCGTLNDITERKLAEAKLEAQEKFLRNVMDVVPSSIFVKDKEGRFLSINKTGATIYGKTVEEMLCQQDSSFNDDPAQIEEFLAVNQEVMTTLQPKIIPNQAIKNAHGEIRWYKTIISPFIDSEGQVQGVIGAATDITDLKEIEEILRQSEARERERVRELGLTLAQLQSAQSQLIQSEKMSSLGQMIAGIAHEINNPTSFIYGNINPALEYAQDLLNLVKLYRQYCPEPSMEITDYLEEIELDFVADDFPKLLASIQEGANRISEIVVSLRSFSRLDEAQCKHVDIHEGIDNTLLILQHRLKPQPHRSGIQVIKEYGQLPRVECYSGELNQVFMNLLSNAIDALEEIGKSAVGFEPIISIRTYALRDDLLGNGSNTLGASKIAISIKDNGSGIAAEVLSKIFDPFFTTKPVGQGTGLGLSISYQIVVDRHGGQLRCDSTLGQGTEFVVELPIEQSTRLRSIHSIDEKPIHASPIELCQCGRHVLTSTISPQICEVHQRPEYPARY